MRPESEAAPDMMIPDHVARQSDPMCMAFRGRIISIVRLGFPNNWDRLSFVEWIKLTQNPEHKVLRRISGQLLGLRHGFPDSCCWLPTTLS